MKSRNLCIPAVSNPKSKILRPEKSLEMMKLLLENKPAILSKWFDLVIETYPPDARRFLAGEKDRFNNPVRHTISQTLEALFDELTGEMNVAKISSPLEELMKIRAVQDFSPSEAVAFIFSLKEAARRGLGEKVLGKSESCEAFFEFDSRIDKVALLAFNKYMECREKVYEIKANELKNRAMAMIEKINRKYGGLD